MVETIRYEKTYFRGVYKDIGVLKKDAQKRNFSYFRKLYRGSIKGVMKGDRKSNLKRTPKERFTIREKYKQMNFMFCFSALKRPARKYL